MAKQNCTSLAPRPSTSRSIALNMGTSSDVLQIMYKAVSNESDSECGIDRDREKTQMLEGLVPSWSLLKTETQQHTVPFVCLGVHFDWGQAQVAWKRVGTWKVPDFPATYHGELCVFSAAAG